MSKFLSLYFIYLLFLNRLVVLPSVLLSSVRTRFFSLLCVCSSSLNTLPVVNYVHRSQTLSKNQLGNARALSDEHSHFNLKKKKEIK